MAVMLMEKVHEKVGVRAAAGIGTNLYLAKIALDITAKHADDFIGILDEDSYRETLWEHRPLTDFWRVGPGTAERLAGIGITTMGQLANADEDLLYDMFGIDAELLIDHAWGTEPVTIADIKAYKPKSNSLTSGQVLMRDYTVEEGRLIIREMAEELCLDMVRKNLQTTSMSIYVGYAKQPAEKASRGAVPARNAGSPQEMRAYYGSLPSVRGSISVPVATNAISDLVPRILQLYEEITDEKRMIRRFFVHCNDVSENTGEEQLSMFGSQDMAGGMKDPENGIKAAETAEKEKADSIAIQKTMVDIKKRFGKNAIFKSADLKEEATALERNMQIGGHKSGE
jgi:DNA polymerase V